MSTPITRIQLRRKPAIGKRFALAAFLIAGFLLLGFALDEPWIVMFDLAAGDAVRVLQSEMANEIARVFDFLGSTAGFTALALAAAGVSFALRRPFDAILTIAAVLGAWLINTVAKNAFIRPRPELEALFDTSGFSYPSGNATIAAALFGCAAVVFAAGVRSVAAKWLIVLVAILLPVLIGITRIYAGVHYPTDILGGYLLGLGYVIGLLAMRKR